MFLEVKVKFIVMFIVLLHTMQSNQFRDNVKACIEIKGDLYCQRGVVVVVFYIIAQVFELPRTCLYSFWSRGPPLIEYRLVHDREID